MWYAILGAVLLAGDQILKYWVVTHLAVGESAPFLPGFMQLTRLHNYGAAWSSFSGRTVLLVVFTAVLLAAVALLLLKKVVRHWTGVTACTLILSGGIGNIIDRIVHGYVVDIEDHCVTGAVSARNELRRPQVFAVVAGAMSLGFIAIIRSLIKAAR